ncbi:MFS transporter [Trichococcus shcherbakoviae]|uniref:MFS transporter n=1 Tax=Trichococcus shcherbakoviae subsp. psychrophilus TaxID=2585775 RepID=A0A5C5E688_9LACT|nr:MFS transporter [Trichococcus shcherbakoviae]TNV68307.1 MFS transporter [Trichococcus shcherbakoviae subsp. psychrophilus]
MKKPNMMLLVFSLMSFVLAMTAFVFSGILDKVAVSLGISVAESGLLNTMYSYGAAFGVPITLILFRKVERSRMLKLMLFATILTTFALIYAQNFVQLLIVRLLMGISANSYGVLAISTILALSPKDRQGRSLAFYIMGSSLALVIGIPLTRALSSILDWRSIFWILNAMMLLSLAYFMKYLPKADHEATKLDLKNELQFFKDGKTLLLLAYTLMMFMGYNAFYTYATPYLLLLFPSIEPLMSLILVALGLASFTGNLLGGHVSDAIGYAKSMMLGAVLQTAAMLLILVFQPSKWLSVLFIIIWLMSAWFTGLQLNTGIAQVTDNKSSFMLSINGSLIQLGGAFGASLAAVVINLSGIQSIAFIALLTSLALVLIQAVSMKKFG